MVEEEEGGKAKEANDGEKRRRRGDMGLRCWACLCAIRGDTNGGEQHPC